MSINHNARARYDNNLPLRQLFGYIFSGDIYIDVKGEAAVYISYYPRRNNPRREARIRETILHLTSPARRYSIEIIPPPRLHCAIILLARLSVGAETNIR